MSAHTQLLERSVDHIGGYSSPAHFCELRQAGLAGKSDAAGASVAAERAIHSLTIYASSATSGGEGTALSRERDQRIAAKRECTG